MATTGAADGDDTGSVSTLFGGGHLSATTLTGAWTLVFLLASAGSSAAYLTVSEVFPLEIRALSIALCYAVGTGLGGIIGPLSFGHLVDTGRQVGLADTSGGVATRCRIVSAAVIRRTLATVPCGPETVNDSPAVAQRWWNLIMMLMPTEPRNVTPLMSSTSDVSPDRFASACRRAFSNSGAVAMSTSPDAVTSRLSTAGCHVTPKLAKDRLASEG